MSFDDTGFGDRVELPWTEVRDAWSQREANSNFDQIYRARNVAGWSGFREQGMARYGLDQFDLDTMQWFSMKTRDIRAVGQISCGPFEGWRVKCGGDTRRSLPMAQIVTEDRFESDTRRKIYEIALAQHEILTAIALGRPEGPIMLIDGHHSVSAIVRASLLGLAIPELELHLGQVGDDRLAYLHRIMQGNVAMMAYEDINTERFRIF
jgi:hypothetical protein